MSAPRPIQAHREVTGAGPTVLCLHSSTSSSKQWQPLAEELAERYRVVAVDLYGYGKTPGWEEERPLRLDDEVALFADLLEGAEEPVHVVGHSYGGAVAARAALRYPGLIASLTLYEPVLFNLLTRNSSSVPAAEEIRSVEQRVRGHLESGELAEGTRHFIDYWSGRGAWESLPEWRQASLQGKISKVVSDFDAVLGNDDDLAQYRRFHQPTLLLYGLNSPLSSRRVIELLASAIPHAEMRGLLGLGHMGPVTHPEPVNRLVVGFLDALVARGRDEREQIRRSDVA